MDKTEEEIKRGLRAELLLEDDTFKEVVDYLLHEQWMAFLATDPLDAQAREKIHSYADAIGGIQTTLKNWKHEADFHKDRLQREKNEPRTKSHFE